MAKILKNLTACFAIVMLLGCSSSYTGSSVSTFNRNKIVQARINLALAYLEQHHFAKAKENIDKALQHDAQDYLPYSALAYYYQQIGDLTQAANAYQTALTLGNNTPDVLNNYGTFLCHQGKFDLAYQQFEQAIKSQQSYYHQADSLENIILCAKQEKNTAKIAIALQQLTALDKTRADALR
ncbi:type IV pilus biogenesis/stability protein PilW [[Haemophilus] ducreyi]|uniref:Fimbrial biogenesis and twitching motility protein PilF-like protein n=2 Tax=Haemophilus ducreyi TaxID=730 RepID=Q7VNZ5_HAEDU|nr:type IV pilus biogenesis/stability protein PilW [[Haemophilus] ducreyi]AAP95295.1 putative fimbrial biogenesis and twitching motility protein PilF-like protein [[Haemophilus] ducreyi 35000HP]AKO30423.1 fimbrial protein [[Haemophilus] ducreyi]AKO31858.1 fimbrial protein [[Haemophilus] ducreyi]AKO33312.1 fimbrial protein [[Haemophilus] ducreyi]AKO34760.1 fimbrial protein [[Haemophilus] ducreyi]